MKKLYLIGLTLLFSASAASNTFYNYDISGYGIINDSDGHVNLRKLPDLKSKIIDKIDNGTLVYCYNEGGRVDDFCYSQTKKGLGYIHTSRILVLEDKFKYKALSSLHVLYNKKNKIYIRYNENNYTSICINDRLNCISQEKIKNIKNININSHVAYFDKKSGNIYLTASNGTDGNTHNIVWTIKPDNSITQWVYTFDF
ncbi:hypothetical protein [Psychrobacter fozii]|uniref:hypothetical protein n=1 Tax=Psychrobacter fozii TaxID=198480 RepID=UPI001917EE72|nr:hypothetical protein [Psychrobacter fozii]